MIYFGANPYAGETFFGFFAVLLQRIAAFFLRSSESGLMSDEIQCIVLVLLGLSLAFLGSFLVVKQMTMLANALSHTLLVGIVIAFLILHQFLGGVFFLESFSSMKVLWVAALITGLITTLSTELLTHKFKVQEDASIGLVFTTLFALGIFLVTVFTRNMHIGVEAIMGNIDVLHIDDIQSAGMFTLVTLCVYLLFFRGFFAAAFDPIFSKTLGFPVRRLDYLLMVLTAGGAIASFRAVGVLLFLALLVGPVLIARLYTHSLKKMIFFSFVISSSCSLFSVALSRHILTVFQKPISTSGLIVSCLFSVYLLALWSSKKGKVLKKFS